MSNGYSSLEGLEFDSKYGRFKVLKKREIIIGPADKIDHYKDNPLYEIEFLNTGYRTVVTRSSIYHKTIVDKLLISVYGIGYIGYDMKFYNDPLMQIIYKKWSDMLERCYDPKYKSYKQYGGSGIRVTDRWLCFNNFYLDIHYLYNFNRFSEEPHMYSLDKDFLQQNVDKYSRIYSKDTCIWVSIHENNIIKGRDTGSTGYYGVVYDSKFYYTKLWHGIIYGRFETPEEAAALYNYLYPIFYNGKYFTTPIFNIVPYIPFEELNRRNLIINRTNIDKVISENSYLFNIGPNDYLKRVDIK